MSKRIDYNNDNNIAPADRAVIVPNAAPNAAASAAKSSKMTKGAKALAIILIVIAVCAIALLVVNLVVNSYVNKINNPHYDDVVINIAPEITNEQVSTAIELNPEGFEELCMNTLLNYAEASHSIKADENVYNFAIYGINKTSDNSQGGIATFVSVVSFNKETKKVTYAVFKEMVLTYIPMVGMGGLQDAYEWGGAPLLTKTIKHNFGIEINGYIEVNMDVAATLVNNVGGIQIPNTDQGKVNDAIDAYNAKFGKNVEYPNVSNGKVTLNGEQTMAFLRADYDNSNDVFKVLGDTVFKSGLSGIIDNAKIVLDETQTSISKDDFIDVAKMALAMLGNAETSIVNVGESTYDVLSFNRQNHRVFYCDMEAERTALVNALYGAPAAE